MFEAELSALKSVSPASSQLTPPSSESTSLYTHDDVTMVDECKQSTTTSSPHVKKTFKWTHFMAVWKSERIYTVIVYLQDVIWSMHFQSISRNMTIESGNSLAFVVLLTHWGRVTHICVGNLPIIGSDNDIIRTNAWILLIGPLGTNSSDILVGNQTFSFRKIHLKMSSAL